MIAKILISPSIKIRIEEIDKILSQAEYSKNHPDLLYLDSNEKLGIEQAKQIIDHFSMKPYQAKGRAAVLEDTSKLTVEAQNALLKTLEEPPEEAILILGAASDVNFLPTILSRCEIVILNSIQDPKEMPKQVRHDIEVLLSSTTEERFEYIEKLKDREEFLHEMTNYFQKDLRSHPGRVNLKFLKELLLAEQWAAQNVNIRAILEYLMLILPSKDP